MGNVYFWAPSVRFRVENGELKVERFNYGKKGAEFFPEFYYYTQKGTSVEKLREHFSEEKRVFLNNLIGDFIRKKILVKSIASPKEIFYSQKKLYINEYDKDMCFIKEKLEKFKLEQSERHTFRGDISYILENSKKEKIIEERHSVREFNSTPISYSDFSAILGYLKNKPESHTRYYPTAGGLATVDIYIHIKAKRVTGVEAGVYYYDPVENSIIFIEDGKRITAEAHYITNKDIFESSAFTIYFVYNAGASMPKYEGMAYYYGIIECGIIVSLLTYVGEKVNIGSCCIGDMHYEKVKPCFKLNEDQVILHSMEFGVKKTI